MTPPFQDIGNRLRAYRLGHGLTAAAIAEKLGVSRAAVYRIEAGEVVKVETVARIAKAIGTSTASLLGVAVEYYSNAPSYFERMRQLEAESQQVVAHFEPVSYLLTTGAYTAHLRTMLIESLPPALAKSRRATAEIDRLVSVLEHRKSLVQSRRFNIVSLITVSEIERFLQLGLIGRFDLPAREWERRRAAARDEIAHVARLMREEPIGVQIGLVEDTMPNITFQLFRGESRTVLATSPFRLGELPNVRVGIATVTAAEEAVTLYESMVADLWKRALKGAGGAALLEKILERNRGRRGRRK